MARYSSREKIRSVAIQRQGLSPQIFESPTINYPNVKSASALNLVSHIWVYGDHYFKLAKEFYSDEKLWWIIAWFNMKPTEAHVELGEIIYIPTPLEVALRIFNTRK